MPGPSNPPVPPLLCSRRRVAAFRLPVTCSKVGPREVGLGVPSAASRSRTRSDSSMSVSGFRLLALNLGEGESILVDGVLCVGEGAVWITHDVSSSKVRSSRERSLGATEDDAGIVGDIRGVDRAPSIEALAFRARIEPAHDLTFFG